MTRDHSHNAPGVSSDAADHIVDARARARMMLGGEAHLGAVDDWRRMLVSARDTLILLWLAWVALHGFGDPPFVGAMLVALTFGLALLLGASTARSTHSQLQYYASELDRERKEIREDFGHECEEVRVLYAAKGFSGPLLAQVVDTLTADEDRLLKVMMEEELGLSMAHINHPLIVGTWNFGSALLAGLIFTLPVFFYPSEAAHLWMPLGGTILLFLLSIISSRATQRGVLEFFTVGLVMATVTGGAVYFLAQWLNLSVVGTQGL